MPGSVNPSPALNRIMLTGTGSTGEIGGMTVSGIALTAILAMIGAPTITGGTINGATIGAAAVASAATHDPNDIHSAGAN